MVGNMKKSFLFLIILTGILFNACGKTRNESKTVDLPVAAPVNPEYIKLSTVLNQMSDRFKDKVSISENSPDEIKDAFLDELKNVLSVEKNYRKDDLDLYFLIDKKHSVSKDYVPAGLISLKKNNLFNINRNDLSLAPDAYNSLLEMAEASLKDGIKLLVSSTYRSYDYQAKLFQRWVDIDGLEEAERESARPGTSQHQLGMAIDFGSITDDFADTKMGKWIYTHGPEYGWSLSFPMNYEDVTGYRWESWHFRFIGKEACNFQKKYFDDVQQFMLEFIDAWKKAGEN